MSPPPHAFELATNALALLAAGQREAALAKVRSALTADPEFKFTHFVHGTILNSLDRWPEALAAYDRAAMVEAACWHYQRATSLSKMGRHDEALAAADEAIRISPDDPLPWYRKGAALIRYGRRNPVMPDKRLLRRGEAALRRAIELDPECYIAWFDLAALHVAENRKSARTTIKEGLALKFGDPRIHAVAAEEALRSGRLDEAAGHVDIVISAQPGSPVALDLAIRLRRARTNPLSRIGQRLGGLLLRHPALLYSLAVPFGIGLAALGLGRTQTFALLVFLFLAFTAWIAWGAHRAVRAGGKPVLSRDF